MAKRIDLFKKSLRGIKLLGEEVEAEGDEIENYEALPYTNIVPKVASMVMARKGLRITPENLEALKQSFNVELSDELLSTEYAKDLTDLSDSDATENLRSLIAVTIGSNENNEKVMALDMLMRDVEKLRLELTELYKDRVDEVLGQVQDLVTKLQNFTVQK